MSLKYEPASEPLHISVKYLVFQVDQAREDVDVSLLVPVLLPTREYGTYKTVKTRFWP